jgi:hypothetical protein
MLHVYLRRSPSPVQGMSTSASATSIRTTPAVQPVQSSYSASNLTAGGIATRGQLSPFSMGEPLGEPRHQYRPQRPTRLNVPHNAHCLSCLPAGLNFSAAMTVKQQMPALSREEVSYSDPDLSSVLSLTVRQGTVRRGADKSLAFPSSRIFMLIILLSHQSLLFCICVT